MTNSDKVLFADVPRSRVIKALEENGMFQCVFCMDVFKGFGNNPEPAVMEDGERCCSDCNMMYVIPSRLKAMNAQPIED